MIPVMLNSRTLKTALIGEGEKLHARHAKLKELGTSNLTVISSGFNDINFQHFDVVMVVGLPEDIFTNLHSRAKAAGCLVNVEDKKEYCDFFFQSFVKRGNLLISVSTNGNTPGTNKIIRDKIEEIFPAEWEDYINQISEKRVIWKSEGKTYDEVNKLTGEFVRNNKWL